MTSLSQGERERRVAKWKRVREEGGTNHLRRRRGNVQTAKGRRYRRGTFRRFEKDV